MNIAGFEFGCTINGACPLDTADPPLTTLGGGDGLGQMQHFAGTDNMNVFRLPIPWQYLLDNTLGGTLNAKNFANFDLLMQDCLKTGASCVIDIHNFARWNGGIIAQGGPTDAQFTSLWTQLATKYLNDTRVMFGLMNEPWDLDVPTWATSVQTVVTAIRKLGATEQIILLPGTNFTSAGATVSSGSGAELIKITNPDGSTTGLVLDVHKYLDSDNSGTHNDCVTDNIADAFEPLAAFLRTNNRTALVTETGAGNTTGCFTDFCAQNTYLNNNSDVFLGYVAWGGGSFAVTDLLSLVPTVSGKNYTDNPLLTECVLGPWIKAGGGTSAVLPSSSTSASSSTQTGAGSQTTGSSSGTSGSPPGSTTTSTTNPATGGKSGAGVTKVGSWGLIAGSILVVIMAL